MDNWRRHVREIQIQHHVNKEVPDFPRVEKVIHVLRGMLAGKLLDVGYSPGSFADYLAEVGWECVGLTLTRPECPKVQIVQCDLNDGFPIKSESSDVITAGEIIEHMIDERAFLEECRRVLKLGGLLVLTTPNLAFLLNRLLIMAGRVPMFVYAPYHYHFHTRRTIVRLVEEHGFRVEKVSSSHVLYSRRRHPSGRVFEWLGDLFPTFGAHLIVFAKKH